MENKQFHAIKELHTAFGSPVATEPTILSGAGHIVNQDYSDILDKISLQMKAASKSGMGGQVLARASWMLEELSEFLAATTLEDQADAMTDLGYFKDGTFVEMGVLPEPLFDIVHDANMGKLWPDGNPRFDQQGKWIKPPTWEAPEPKIAAEIERQRTNGAECWKCGGSGIVSIGPGVRGVKHCPYCKRGRRE